MEPFLNQYFFKYPPKRPVLWAQHDILFTFLKKRLGALALFNIYCVFHASTFFWINRACIFNRSVDSLNKILKLEHESLLTGELTVHVIYGNIPGTYCLRQETDT